VFSHLGGDREGGRANDNWTSGRPLRNKSDFTTRRPAAAAGGPPRGHEKSSRTSLGHSPTLGTSMPLRYCTWLPASGEKCAAVSASAVGRLYRVLAASMYSGEYVIVKRALESRTLYVWRRSSVRRTAYLSGYEGRGSGRNPWAVRIAPHGGLRLVDRSAKKSFVGRTEPGASLCQIFHLRPHMLHSTLDSTSVEYTELYSVFITCCVIATEMI
jgi:hypothetical protein